MPRPVLKNATRSRKTAKHGAFQKVKLLQMRPLASQVSDFKAYCATACKKLIFLCQTQHKLHMQAAGQDQEVCGHDRRAAKVRQETKSR